MCCFLSLQNGGRLFAGVVQVPQDESSDPVEFAQLISTVRYFERIAYYLCSVKGLPCAAPIERRT